MGSAGERECRRARSPATCSWQLPRRFLGPASRADRATADIRGPASGQAPQRLLPPRRRSSPCRGMRRKGASRRLLRFQALSGADVLVEIVLLQTYRGIDLLDFEGDPQGRALKERFQKFANLPEDFLGHPAPRLEVAPVPDPQYDVDEGVVRVAVRDSVARSLNGASPCPAEREDASAQRRFVNAVDETLGPDFSANVGGVFNSVVRHVVTLPSRLSRRARCPWLRLESAESAQPAARFRRGTRLSPRSPRRWGALGDP